MNASLGLRLASQLVSRPCVCAGPIRSLALLRTTSTTTTPLSLLRVGTNPTPTARSIWTVTSQLTVRQDDSKQPRPSNGSTSPLTFLRHISFNRRTRPSPRTRERQSPSLPAPPEPTIAKPASITGAEQEPIRYTDYMRPPGSDSSEPLPPPPPSESQKATSRFIGMLGVIYFIVYLLWWAPYLAAYAHTTEELTAADKFTKYMKPWKLWLEKWFTFSPSVALERLGYYSSRGLPVPGGSEDKDRWLSTFTQFLLPAFSHAETFHLAFNFFALQALAPTMIRYYGFRRSVLAYLGIAVLNFALIIPYDRLFNPYTELPQPIALTRWHNTHERVIRHETKNLPSKAQVEEHYKLGEHCRPSLGASGVLYGFLAITAIVNPAATFELMFIPIGISVRTLFMGLCTLDLTFIGLRNESWGTVGHLTGAVGGLIVWAAWLRRVRLPPDVQRQLMMHMRRKKMGLD